MYGLKRARVAQQNCEFFSHLKKRSARSSSVFCSFVIAADDVSAVAANSRQRHVVVLFSSSFVLFSSPSSVS